MKVANFVTWGTAEIPNYTRYYIEQLRPWFDEFHVSCNSERPVDVSWFESRRIHLHFFPNTSRDMQKHHDWLMVQGRERVTSFSELTLINDCLVCYGPIDNLMNWCRSRAEDCVGINSSKFPISHIQSYFLMLKPTVIGKVWDHFKATGVVRPMKEIDDYELKISLLGSMNAMFPQADRRGWDELFYTPFDNGVPLVKQQCLMPRKPFLLKKWQKRIDNFAHPDTKAWQLLPVCGDKEYIHRTRTETDAPHFVMYEGKNVVTVQQTKQD